MAQYHANSRPDMEALITTEGDALQKAGFKLPRFDDRPEEYDPARPLTYKVERHSLVAYETLDGAPLPPRSLGKALLSVKIDASSKGE